LFSNLKGNSTLHQATSGQAGYEPGQPFAAFEEMSAGQSCCPAILQAPAFCGPANHNPWRQANIP
jgi:hypothetical protein